MATLSDCHEPGILIVLSQPRSREYLADIHEWYNTEHGPARLRLGDEYFSNGYRYKTSGEDATWLAIYDMRRISAGADKKYTILREKRSAREQVILNTKNNNLSRRFLRLILKSGDSLVSNTPAKFLCHIAFHAPRKESDRVIDWYKDVRSEIFQMT